MSPQKKRRETVTTNDELRVEKGAKLMGGEDGCRPITGAESSFKPLSLGSEAVSDPGWAGWQG